MGALLVFDVTDRASFDSILKYLEELKTFNDLDCPVILVGNKIDLPNRRVTRLEAQNFADNSNMYYFETSAKTGEGVRELAEKITQSNFATGNVSN